MTRSTSFLFASLALLAGCRDGTPPSEGATAAPEQRTAAATDSVRRLKVRGPGNRALAPGIRRNLLQAAADGGEAPAAGDGDGGAAPLPGAPAVRAWSFDQDKADEAPAGFELASSAGKPGNWRVVADPSAKSGPNVLAQLDADKTDARFLTAVAAEPSLRDARVSVRCKPVSGKVDQSCGVVVRYKDAKNYYVARANALEKNVNLYVVKDGKRTLVGGWKGETPAGAWHELRVDARGEHLEVWWEGAKVYEADDKTFLEAGRFGLWTKADSVTHFDDFTVTAL